ncbi:enoyl-[acyl-carrier protein] reductase II [Marinitoga hydrogenitolerans DSM 16785]|uniref:Enoyl-[acyl-carrier protein] reductase II n=1 Tax=Marinitoga hydrogenitolerans (strain DSM 16785 / JCM 12826 / AT1271) TaxID=1122195 RepID=A0A1M4S5J5_MARH1|nr:nitronate monooxygenase [Marinitoga hydrogenitolerans]SHE27473.1 enoyl-[acyl-carrier protein] reductase II [Marinitoga hydrogenitolerans DSM 16785]
MNRVTKLLNIEYPILEGGMAWVGTAKLAAAVSEAGGLGTIGAGSMTPEILKEAIKKIKTLTNKTFAVNIILVNPYADQLVEIAKNENVPVVIFGAGNPGKYISSLKEKNIKVLAVVSSENLAKRLEKAGVDAIIGEGMECGGHIGDVTTMVLIPKLVDVLNIPVIAAGGIADLRGMKAVVELGAEGIQMGTRFIATPECEAHENYKKIILKAGIRDAIVTGAAIGHPARVIKTKFAKKIKQLEASSPEEAEEMLIGSLRKAFIDGDLENGSFMAGQSAGLINEIKSVKDIIDEFGKEFEKMLIEKDVKK